MPRRPRVFIEGGIFHVYNRFARGAEVFREGDEGERFLTLLRTVKDRDGLVVFAWALMSNHFHLALRVGPVPLWRSFGWLQARFGQDYNRRHRSSGPLWQSRFKARLVEEERYLGQLIAYIHLNPVTAGMVRDPADYPLSGHRELLGKGKGRGSLVDVDEVLAAFGPTVRSSRRAYVKALEGVAHKDWRTELPGRLPWWGRDPDRPLEPESPSAWVDAQGRSTGLERPRVNAPAFAEAARRTLGLSPSELSGRGSGRSTTRARCLLASLAVERWGIPTKGLADLLGRRADVVSRWVRWGAERREAEAAFRRAYDDLDKALSQVLKDAPSGDA